MTALFIALYRIMLPSHIAGIPSRYEDRKSAAVHMIIEVVLWAAFILFIWLGTDDIISDDIIYRFAGRRMLTATMVYFVVLFLLMAFIPMIFTKVSSRIWLSKHPDSSAVEFYSTYDDRRSQHADILSIDHIPVKQNKGVRLHNQTLYVTSGSHQVEIGIYRLSHGYYNNRVAESDIIETGFVFEAGRHYRIRYCEGSGEAYID